MANCPGDSYIARTLLTPSRSGLPVAVSLIALLAACDHTIPPGPQDYSAKTPLGTGSPARLTYNPGVDERVTWLPDGSAFLYTTERLDTPERDRCIAQMPATGGAIGREICSDPLTSADSQNTFESAAAGPDGDLVYVRTATMAFRGRLGADRAAVVLASMRQPLSGTVLEPLAFFGPSARPVSIISSIHWVGVRSLIFLAERLAYEAPCGSCTPDTLRWGLDVERLYLGTGGQVDSVTAVSGSDGASSLAVAGADTIYYTVNGDSRLYRRLLSQPAPVVVHDFGVVVRDVGVTTAGLSVVAGGAVTYGFDAAQGASVQRDRGGDLHVLEVGGSDVAFPMPAALVRRPVPSPDGRVIIFEARAFAADTFMNDSGVIVRIDTIVAPAADLWRMRVP